MSAADHKTFILDSFVPALNRMLLAADEPLFRAYLGSACRQTAICVAHEMSQRMPGQKWKVFDGQFTGSPKGTPQVYNHAWVWSDGGIFIDANHRREHRIWDTNNPNTYPAKSIFASRWKEIGRTELPWEAMLLQPEYYTGAAGLHLHAVASKIANSTPPYLLRDFDLVTYAAIRPEWMDA